MLFMLSRLHLKNHCFFIGFPMFSHMLLMVIKFSVVRKRPRMMRGCCEYSRRSPCLFGLPYYLITRKAREGEEGKIQSQPEEPRGDQTTRRDAGEVPEKEPQSRLSRRNQRKERPRAGPVQPRLYSPLSVTREREKTEEGEAQKEASERPQRRISSLSRVEEARERKETARASQRSRGGQRRERLRRKLRRGPGVGWDWFSNSIPLVFLSEPIREPTK